MSDIVELISGNVPGGFLLLLFVLFSANLSLFFLYRSSQLFTKETYRINIFKINVPILAFYLAIWFALRPPALPPEITFLPVQYGDEMDLKINSWIETSLNSQNSKKYILHRWEQLFKTANKDSVSLKSYREALARRVNCEMIVSGLLGKNGKNIILNAELIEGTSLERNEFKATSYNQLAQSVLSWVVNTGSVNFEPLPKSVNWDDSQLNLYTHARQLYLQEDYDASLAAIHDTTLPFIKLKAWNYLKQGIASSANKKERPLEKSPPDPNFLRVKKLLFPFIKNGKDDSEINLILGQVNLYEKNYETADILLSKSMVQDPYDPRIYYGLSFLHESRLAELGFDDRIDVLEKAVRLYPGYTMAVHELADEYFRKGAVSPTGLGTTQAIETLNNYLKINANEISILTLLGNIHLYIKESSKAIGYYEKILELNPELADIQYNLGICYFNMKEYDRSESYFRKTLAIEDYADAYLYLGAIYQLRKDYDKALEFYRERVKRKSGDDDYYAIQAMHGIHNLLTKYMAGDSSTTDISLPAGSDQLN